MPSNGSIEQIKIKNLLSFGSQGVEFQLHPLNVLIGPNGAGKSNLMGVLSLLQAAPSNLSGVLRRDGVAEWLWKGSAEASPLAEIGACVQTPTGGKLEYSLEFGSVGERFQIIREELLGEPGGWLYRFGDGGGWIERAKAGGGRERAELTRESIKSDATILAQRREPDLYPELAALSALLSNIRLYTGWSTGAGAAVRDAKGADTEGGFLAEDGSNLAIVLGELKRDNQASDLILQYMRDFNAWIVDIYTGLTGGKLQVYVREQGLRAGIPASRLSDGTLRFLSLLTILCHPSPPAVVAIEEPELGLHPDMLPAIAELLVEASSRTQLIVTTHSDLLISQFTEQPEVVVVCDRGPDGTYFQRLTKELLGEEELSLGSQWLKGQIGGTRW